MIGLDNLSARLIIINKIYFVQGVNIINSYIIFKLLIK